MASDTNEFGKAPAGESADAKEKRKKKYYTRQREIDESKAAKGDKGALKEAEQIYKKRYGNAKEIGTYNQKTRDLSEKYAKATGAHEKARAEGADMATEAAGDVATFAGVGGLAKGGFNLARKSAGALGRWGKGAERAGTEAAAAAKPAEKTVAKEAPKERPVAKKSPTPARQATPEPKPKAEPSPVAKASPAAKPSPAVSAAPKESPASTDKPKAEPTPWNKDTSRAHQAWSRLERGSPDRKADQPAWKAVVKEQKASKKRNAKAGKDEPKEEGGAATAEAPKPKPSPAAPSAKKTPKPAATAHPDDTPAMAKFRTMPKGDDRKAHWRDNMTAEERDDYNVSIGSTPSKSYVPKDKRGGAVEAKPEVKASTAAKAPEKKKTGRPPTKPAPAPPPDPSVHYSTKAEKWYHTGDSEGMSPEEIKAAMKDDRYFETVKGGGRKLKEAPPGSPRAGQREVQQGTNFPEFK